jgi:hypothetical protein
MRSYGPLLLAPLAWGCATTQPPRLASDPGIYTLRDTTVYENEVSSGEFALLVRNGRIVDSVDLHFGVHRLNSGTVVFLPIKTSGISEDFRELAATKHVAYDGNRRVLLTSFLPHFDDYFSSPAILDGLLYYWGMEQKGVIGKYKLHAIRYDALSRRIDSRFLFEAELATDYSGYLGRPTAQAGMILFETFGRAFLVSPDWRSVQATTPSR